MEIRKSGLVILHKEAGMTSQSAVSRVRRLFGADKAGHTGTLGSWRKARCKLPGRRLGCDTAPNRQR